MEAGKSIIFCATQRSGSTMIMNDLGKTLGRPFFKETEILYDRIIRRGTANSWREVWNEARAENTLADYFIDKVMFHYTPYISDFIAGRPATRPQATYTFVPGSLDAFYRFFRKAIWVYIERQDVFAQAVSLYVAQTSIWPRRRDSAATQVNADLRYDFEHLRVRLELILAEKEQWNRYFQHHHIQPIRIIYEQAARDYPHYLEELLGRAKLRMCEPVPERSVRPSSELSIDFAKRLRDDTARLT